MLAALFKRDSWSWAGLALVLLSIVGLIYKVGSTRRRDMALAVRGWLGVGRERAKRVIKELARKAFHFSGMVMPATYTVGLRNGLMDKRLGCVVMVTVTGLYLIGDVARLSIPAFNHYMLVTLGWNKIMRKEEYHNFTGIGYYFAGNMLATVFFAPTVTIIAMLALILGDFFAALVGKAAGRRKLVGNKSLEGSLGCLAVCFVSGLLVFLLLLPELPLARMTLFSFVGALAATLAELFSISVNDNISIPLACGTAISCLAHAMGCAHSLTSSYEAHEAVIWTWLRNRSAL